MRRPIAVVTTTGLARTPAQVGMLAALADHGITADCVVGTSLGAVNAAALAAGCPTQQMRDFWVWLYGEVLESPVRAIARGLTARTARKQEQQIYDAICELLPATFDDVSVPLRLVATELRNGGEALLAAGPLPEAVMAACALPGLLPPVEVDGVHLLDGGLVAGMPLRFVPPEAKTVVVLDTGHSAVTTDEAAGYRWWEVGALSYAHQIRGQAVYALSRAATRVPVVVVSTDHGGLLEFTDPLALIEAGREAGEASLAALPGRLRKGIYGLPSGLEGFDVLHHAVLESTNG
jgi:NTE family protein